MERATEVNGKELFLYSQKRFNQTPKEALEVMEQNNQDTSFLTDAERDAILNPKKVKPSIRVNGTFDKYKQNLRSDDNYVFSYDTKVAEIDHKNRQITPLGWWSVTTSKHINYVGSEYGYQVQKVN
tara:strand:+ start:103 stop:480 length:378 start_codon:yes stop_codon:yes gene_type:complete